MSAKPAALRRRVPARHVALPGVEPVVEPAREAEDFYPTPRALALACAAFVRDRCVADPQLIVEPSAGDGVFLSAAAEVWGRAPELVAVEVRPRARIFDAEARRLMGLERATTECSRWEDAPQTRDRIAQAVARHERVVVIGNPPNLLAERHIGLALDRLGHTQARQPEPRFLAQLLPSGFLGGTERHATLFDGRPGAQLALAPEPARGGLRFVRFVVGRPDFTGEGGGGYEYVLLVWQVGWREGWWEGGWLTWR